MNERAAEPTQDIIARQVAAGHPTHSVWVSANAGSGKTHILTERVLRILLSGVAPENILCLTYTKAAAAEMQKRVAARLGGWATAIDAELKIDLKKLSDRQPGKDELARARTLFAHALETPGGLKINTIHAFCEATLHRFPFEADVAIDFAVIEEAEQKEMVEAARDAVLAEGLSGDGHVAKAVATLFALMSDHHIEEAVNSALGAGRELRHVLANPEQAKSNLLALLGVSSKTSSATIALAGIEGLTFTPELAARVFAILPPDTTKNRFSKKLVRLDWSQITLEDLFNVFLTDKGKIPKSGFVVKPLIDKDPGLADAMLEEAERLEELYAQLVKARLIERSEALLDVMVAIRRRYDMAKRVQGRLDFDDLVTKLEALLAVKENSHWVRYKLDAGITHILVDESQDTNPGQWNVVRQLVDDFFDGDTAVERPRTLFAVGDEKQSIYSFQGADPALFGETGRELALRAMSVNKPWDTIRFRASFRTLENILDAVDLVCARPDISTALLAEDAEISHESARVDKGGSVTLWPPVQIEDADEIGNDWPTSPGVSTKTAPRILGERIAAQIKHWIDSKRPLAARQRAVSPDDILILVQSRGPVFKEIIRALKQTGIPTPGADRLPVTDHIVVRDLLVLGEVLLNPADDLALATLLRSPLFGIGEDQLEILCADRGQRISVWQSLSRLADNQIWAATALEQLVEWRQKLDFDRPYEFFASVLFAQNGLRKFHGRLGEEIDDVISEFMDLALAHELGDQPSLQGFLANLKTRDISIKRELSDAGGGVRVMSVHGAKGLEAPIVILADATSVSNKTGPTFLKGNPTPLLIHASAKDDHTPETNENLRQSDLDAQMAEYWRKLYVAMTRSEDELYVTGALTKREKNTKDCWYEAIKEALQDNCIDVPLHNDDTTGLRFPLSVPEPKAVAIHQSADQSVQFPPLPGNVGPTIRIETIRPSTATDHTFDPADLLNTGVERVMSAQGAKRRGVVLHTLLQHLAPIAPDIRAVIAHKAIADLLPGHPELHSELVQKALNILSGPDAEHLFGVNSRAELPIFVTGTKSGKPVRIIGRIDRTIVTNEHVSLVDFKSDGVPATTPEQVKAPYLTQLGLYLRACEKLFPDRTIDAAIYWTQSENLMPLPTKRLLEATMEFKFS